METWDQYKNELLQIQEKVKRIFQRLIFHLKKPHKVKVLLHLPDHVLGRGSVVEIAPVLAEVEELLVEPEVPVHPVLV